MANNKLDTQLDPKLIKHFMDKAGRNPKHMAEVLNKENASVDLAPARRRKWSRVMDSGKVSGEDAELIAQELGVSVNDLQHPNLQERKDALKVLIKCAVKKMKAANDKDGLARIAEALNFDEASTEGRWDAADDSQYAELAQTASSKIEWLHLFGEIDELESFANVFGVTAQKMRPAALASFWLFSSSSRYCFSMGKLVVGYAGVLAEIEKNWEAIPDFFRNKPEALKATVSKEGKRYRLRFETTQPTFTFSCLFYACDTRKKTGLPSLDAPKWEIEKLMTSLKYFLFDHAGMVVINGETFPPDNKSCVFQVRSFNVDDGNSHQEIGTRIIDDNYLFRASLQILLRTHDSDKWRFTNPDILAPSWISPAVEISLLEKERVSKIYEITWGWQENDGGFHGGHWPLISRKKFISEAMRSRDLPIWIVEENDVISPFEPEPQAPANEGVSA